MASSRNMLAARNPNRTTRFIMPQLYASKDPVALDAVALKYFEQWRARGSLPAIAHWLAMSVYASQIGLGNSAPNRIEVKNIGR